MARGKEREIGMDVNVTVRGYLGSDPVLKETPAGMAWTKFRVGTTRRWRDTETSEWVDGPTMWFTVRLWDAKARNVADTLKTGMPVLVTGRLAEEPYVWTRPGSDGEPVSDIRANLLIENAAVALDLSLGTAKYERIDRDGDV